MLAKRRQPPSPSEQTLSRSVPPGALSSSRIQLGWLAHLRVSFEVAHLVKRSDCRPDQGRTACWNCANGSIVDLYHTPMKVYGCVRRFGICIVRLARLTE